MRAEYHRVKVKSKHTRVEVHDQVGKREMWITTPTLTNPGCLVRPIPLWGSALGRRDVVRTN